MQHARGVLQQIADPEVALGFVWLELHLGHVLGLVANRRSAHSGGPAGRRCYLESLSLEYAEQCRAQLQRLALDVPACPIYGLEYVRELLGG